MQAKPAKARGKKYPGYNTLMVVWHESINKEFDPVSALKEVATSRGLIVDLKAHMATPRLRVDSVESQRLRRKLSQPIDKPTADRIRDLVERARQGEDVSQALLAAMDPDS
jgi:hypothetical protein